MKNLCGRTDPDGFIHTSYHDAPSWRYDGFGPYVLKANSAVGVSPLWGDTVKVMPRLPRGWRVSVKDFPLLNTCATVGMETAYPVEHTQAMILHLKGDCGVSKANIRFGPFPKETREATVSLNNESHTVPTEVYGDASWAWLTVDVSTL